MIIIIIGMTTTANIGCSTIIIYRDPSYILHFYNDDKNE